MGFGRYKEINYISRKVYGFLQQKYFILVYMFENILLYISTRMQLSKIHHIIILYTK